MEQLTIKKIMECKKLLEEAERKRPKIIIDGVEYIEIDGTNKRRNRSRESACDRRA